MKKRRKRMGLRFFLYLWALGAMTGCKQVDSTCTKDKLESQFLMLLQQTDIQYESLCREGGNKFFPRSIKDDGKISFVASGDWCSGFFPGCLWLMAELTADTSWVKPAEKYTQLLKNEQWNTSSHDIGFKIMSSFGNELKQNANRRDAELIVQSAKSLISRYNDVVGCIRSWDHNIEQWYFPVIIDNMMNLELLFKATELSGDSLFYKIAVKHANTTLKNHFREDGSTYHVVDYFPETGKIHEKVTHQGDSDQSTWARGQAWALYGYTMCYRYTLDSLYLKQACKIADYVINHPDLPNDKIPMWDFNYKEDSGEFRDVSAASVIASALFELSDYKSERPGYLQFANQILDALQNGYSCHNGENQGYLLSHSVGFRHRNLEVDVPIIYADYYFLEALIRQKNRENQLKSKY